MGVIEEKRVAQMGTFNGNPLTMAASKVTLLEILDAKAYAHFDALAETLQGGLDEAMRRYELPFHATTLAARGGVTYRDKRVRNYRDYLEVSDELAYVNRIRSVTAEQMRGVARRYLDPERYTRLTLLPPGAAR